MQDDEESFHPHPWSDLLERPPRVELISRFLFAAGITTLVGKPGMGKTTMAMALVQTTATGTIFAGQQIEPRPVIWIPGEGLDDLRPMYEAWRRFKKCTVEPQGFFLEDGLDFFNEADTGKLIKKIEGKPPPLIVPDALADMMGDGDEDRTKDMVRVYKNFWRIIKATGACLLVPHHSGHEGQRERGSIVTRAKSDILIQVTDFDAVTGIIKLKHHKRRGGGKQEMCFEVKLVEVPGFKELIPVVTGVERTVADVILGEKPAENEEHGRHLVRVMFEYFFEEGATSKQLHERSAMSDGTFYRGLDYATKNKPWIIGGRGQGQRYRLNPDNSWKAAVMASSTPTSQSTSSKTTSTPDPLQGSGSSGSSLGPSMEAVWKQFGSGSGFEAAKGESPPKTGTDPLSKASELVEKVGAKPPDRRKADAQ